MGAWHLMSIRLRCLPPLVARQAPLIATNPAKVTDPHYLTPQHREWRSVVVARSGERCQGPACVGTAAGGRLFADHIRELRDGGAPFDPANGQALCGACHTRKTLASRASRMAQPT